MTSVTGTATVTDHVTGLTGTGTVQLSIAAAQAPAARIVGAHGLNTADWLACQAAIGAPFGCQRVFYPGALPAAFGGSDAAGLPAGVTAVVSYKTQTTNVAAYVASIPAARPAIMVYHHEPEGDYGSGSQFVSEFVAQAALIRAQSKPNVRVAMCAVAYQYTGGPGSSIGLDGSYLPPASAVDLYTVDAYQPLPDGNGLAGDPKWNNWLALVRNRGKLLGLTEYGLGTNGGQVALRASVIRKDAAYLRSALPALELWTYWDIDDTASEGPTHDYKLTDAAGQLAWHDVLTGKA